MDELLKEGMQLCSRKWIKFVWSAVQLVEKINDFAQVGCIEQTAYTCSSYNIRLVDWCTSLCGLLVHVILLFFHTVKELMKLQEFVVDSL